MRCGLEEIEAFAPEERNWAAYSQPQVTLKRSSSTELFNAEVFVVLLRTITMECDLFGEGRSSHRVMGVGVSKSDVMINTSIAH